MFSVGACLAPILELIMGDFPSEKWGQGGVPEFSPKSQGSLEDSSTVSPERTLRYQMSSADRVRD
jgi:hypothetical protein